MKFLKNKKQVFAVVASVVCSVFLVAVATFAATTISSTTITLENAETIKNAVNGTITLGDGVNNILIKPTGGTGIDIGDAATTGIDIGNATTGINFTGTYTKGINFATATMTQGLANVLFGIGTQAAAKDIALTDYYLPFVVNLRNTQDASAAMQAGYFKVATDGATEQPNTQLVATVQRVTVDMNLDSAYGVQSHMTVSGTKASSELISVSALTNVATGARTADRVVALQAMLLGEGTPGTVNGDAMVAYFVNAGNLATTDDIVRVYNQSAATTTNGIYINNAGTMTNAIKLAGTVTTGIAFTGTYSDSAIDFSDVTLDHSGAGGPVMIRAGTYASPVASSDPHQSGMIRLYGSNDSTTDDGTGFYDRIIFANSQITGNKSAFPISSLVEIRDVGANDGPVAAMAGQFIAHMTTAGSKLAATATVTDGMFGMWTKVASVVGSAAAATSRVAPIWIDNQMCGTVSGEEYGIFATTGGTVPDAFVGFETTSSGWESLFYFDETASIHPPVISGDTSATSADYHLRVNIDGTMYGIQLYAL